MSFTPGDSGKHWFINEKGGFVSTYDFSDWSPPEDTFAKKFERNSAEVIELRRPSRFEDLKKLPRVA